MSNKLELIEIGARAREFLALDVSEDQRGLVATMAESYADALFPPDYGWGQVKPWLRGITRDGMPAGFVMCADPTPTQVEAWIWRLLVDRNHQGFGVGRFAMQQVLERYRELGVARILVSWAPNANNPSGFYRKLGFKETGALVDEEIVAAIELKL